MFYTFFVKHVRFWFSHFRENGLLVFVKIILCGGILSKYCTVGVVKDDVTAARYYRLASDKAYARAQCYLDALN